MISAEAPVLFAKAAEMFIHELTMRAWIHTEVTNTIYNWSQIRFVDIRYQICGRGKIAPSQDNKRRTLQRNDIAMAITKYDQFDFLIDIVPRSGLVLANGHARKFSPTNSD
jgi:nuclear transcription factor Y gamma